MNFFEQQDLARRNTKLLIALLCLAVISLIFLTTLLFAATFYYLQVKTNGHNQEVGVLQGLQHIIGWNTIGYISVSVCTVILLGSLYKLAQLSGGGRSVAEAMGGHLINSQTTNAHERKILNVVEEMAIASGTSVPPVYLLEDNAINAFAAGYDPQNAVIGITRGCITLLKRDELQGVIAHEFSHIFHGDMKLNMRLVALLNGILLLGLIGHFLVRSSGEVWSFRSSKNKSRIAILSLGMGLIAIGYTGTFFGNLIKSAVSRQREFLADASAVKFTRNPEGISGALKKIGGYFSGSRLENSHAAEFSHMYFSEGVRLGFSQLMATHPPLEERIKRIEPRWDGNFPDVQMTPSPQNFQNNDGEDILGFAQRNTSETGPIEYIVNIEQVLQTIGQPTQSHLTYAQQTLHSISDKIHQAAHNPWEAQALMLGLLLDKNLTQQENQWQLLNSIFSAEQIHWLKPYALQAFALAETLRLPLVELSLPALKQLSPQQYQVFKRAIHSFIHADKHINLIEWSYYHILTHNLEPRKSHQRLSNLSDLKNESITLLSIIARADGNPAADALAAFNSSKTIIALDDANILDEASYSLMDLDLAITRLSKIKPLQKPKLLKAISQCIMFDKKISIAEAELFRAIADGLDCPIPPLILTNP